jgi:RNA polymerase sigma factor (sigma-70 family)
VTPGTTSAFLQGCLNRLHGGETAARADLLRYSQERLRTLTQRMLARFPSVKRFEETDDVLQNVLLRISHMLDQLEVGSVRDYLRLAAANIRRELIDLARHYYGPLGIGANQAGAARGSPDRSDQATLDHPAADSGREALSLADWTEFHERTAQLPDDEREVFDQLWYHGLTQDEAAELLDVSVSTVKRRWQAARLRLMESLGGKSPT